jgi:hypothetical protein
VDASFEKRIWGVDNGWNNHPSTGIHNIHRIWEACTCLVRALQFRHLLDPTVHETWTENPLDVDIAIYERRSKTETNKKK